MMSYLGIYILGVLSGVGLMALFCANGNDSWKE